MSLRFYLDDILKLESITAIYVVQIVNFKGFFHKQVSFKFQETIKYQPLYTDKLINAMLK